MSGQKSKPRSIDEVLEANWIFDLDAASAIIRAVGDQPDIDADSIPESIAASATDRLAEEVLVFHLRGLAKDYRWNERRQNLPHPKDIAKRTRKIADLCRQLADELLDHSGQVVDGLGPGYLFAAASPSGKENGAERVQSIGDGILALKGWAITAADRADLQAKAKPIKRGKPRDDAFHAMLNQLSGVYFYIWRKIPGRSYDSLKNVQGGPYFRFAREVVQRLCPEWVAGRDIDGALAAAIQEHSWPRGLWE